MYNPEQVIHEREVAAPKAAKLRFAAFGALSKTLFLLLFFFAASMTTAMAAEAPVDTSIFATNSSGLTGAPATVCVDDQKCFVFYLDSVGGISMASTTDGGASWTSGRNVDSVNPTDTVSVAVWWEGWTPSTTTTQYIHIATTDTGADDLYYTRYDIVNNTLSASVLATTQAAACSAGVDCYPAITMTSDGVLYMSAAEGADRFVVRCTTDCTNTLNWSELAGGFTGTNGDDPSILMPIPGTNNLLLTWWDFSVNALYFNEYSATSSAWATTSLMAVATAADYNITYDAQFFGMALSSSTGEIALTFVDDANDYTTQDHDIKFYLYASSTGWTQKTNVITNAVGGITGAKVSYDAQNDVWYVIYIRRSTIGTAATANIYYKYSADGGTTWSSEQGPVNASADDLNALTTGITSNERIMAAWNYSTAPKDDDLYAVTVSDIYTSLTIEGTLYEADRVTPVAVSQDVSVVLATSTTSVYSTSTETTTGDFAFTLTDVKGVASDRANIATLFVDDNVSLKATGVVKMADGATVTGLAVYEDHVTLDAYGAMLSATNLHGYDSGVDSDIQFTASSSLGRLTVATGQTLYVASSTTFHIDLPIVGHSFETATTGVAIASSSIALSGNYHNAGTLQTADASSTEWTLRTSAADNSWSSVTYGNGLFVAVAYSGTGNRVQTSPDGITWNSRTSAADNGWNSVTYGNGLFVAVSSSGTGNRVMTSPDGITWTSRTSAADNNWNSVTYGNGLFVVVGFDWDLSKGAVMTSPDGITWTSRTSAADNFWRSVTYGNGLFVAVSNSGTGNRVMTSPDGITWTSRTSAANNWWRSVTYGNGLFVAVADSGTGNRVMTSPDGITWTSRTSAANNNWTSVTYGSGLFVAVAGSGTGNRVMTSSDGITWTARTSAADNSWSSVTYGNGLFVAVSSSGTGNRVMTSAELPYLSFSGTTAQSLSGAMTATSSLPNVVFSESGTKTFANTASTSNLTILNTSGTVIAPDTLTISRDFANSSSFTAPTAFIFDGAGNQIATGTWSGTPNLTVAGSGQKIFTTNASTTDVAVNSGVELVSPPTLSIDGDYTNNGTSSSIATHWTSRTSAADNNWYSVTYGNGLFVAVSNSGTGNRVMTSPDGITWTSRTSAANNWWRSVTYGNGLFVAVSSDGTGNRVMTSSDGITWTSRTSAADNSWSSVTYGNGLFVAVSSSGTGNRVMTSPDGITWTSRTSAADNSWQSVTYGNGLFVAVAYSGTGNRVMTSPDGITWTSRTSAANNSWRSVTYGNGLFVAVADSGTGNRVMTSPDGITWTSRTSAADNSWTSVTYGNGLFVAVSSSGTGNRVQTSPDGITWNSRTSAADNGWNSVTYGNGLFVAVSSDGTGNRVMTSGISTVVFGGASAQSVAGNLTGASAFGHVVFTGAGEKTFVNNASTTNLTITTSATTTFQGALSVLGDLTASTSNAVLVFPSSATSTIYGTTTISGAPDAHVLLRATTPDTQAGLELYGAYAIQYADIKDSFGTSTEGDIICTNCINSGNTTGWNFSGLETGDTFTVSGTLYGSDRTTPITTPTNVTIAVATSTVSTYSTSTDSGTGAFSFSIEVGEVATGTPLTLFVDNDASVKAVTVTRTSGSATITNFSLYQDHVTIRNESEASVGTTTRASDLFAYDSSDDGDVQFTASSTLGRLTVAAGQTLYVASSTTFHVDVPLLGHSFETATTATAIASSSMALAGDYRNAGVLQTAAADAAAWTSRTSAADNSWNSVTYGNGLFVAVAGSGTGNRVMTSPDGITWTSRTSATDNEWYSVTYGNGLFVAVAGSGAGNRVMTSPDGITWTLRTSAADNWWTSVTYGNGLFVAVAGSGAGNRVMTSPDGITWTSRTSAADNWWTSVTYGNGLFVAVAAYATGNGVMTSPDGITWTSRTSAANNYWYSVTYGNGLFVAVANSGTGNRVMTSPDGITWTSRTSAADNYWYSVTYGNGLFVAVAGSGTGNRVMTSPDGITWTARTSAADNSWQSVTYGSGLFVAVSSSGTGNRVMTSSELPYLSFSGTTAQSLSGAMTATSSLPNVVFSESGTKTFTDTASTSNFTITTTSGVVTAPSTLSIIGDFANSSSFTAPTTFIFDGAGNQIATGTWNGTPNLTVAGSGQKIFTTNASTTDVAVNSGAELVVPPTLSIDGDYTNNGTSSSIATQWTFRTSAADNQWLSVTYGNGLFVAVAGSGAGNRVMTSPDGITWTLRTSAADKYWNSVTYGNGLFVAVAAFTVGNGVMTSPDGITWTSRTSAADNEWQSVTYGNGLFVAVSWTGTGNRVMTSPDGITWTSRTSAADNTWRSVTYGNGLFVAVAYSGTGNRVMTSPDGITWTSRTSAADNGWQSVTYGNGLFVAVSNTGTGNRVMTSPDGITWTSRTSAADNYWYSVTYGNGLFVAVACGVNSTSCNATAGNRVMTSPDGITWTLRTSAADNYWLSVTYGNGLFVAVSYDGTGNRVMTSGVSTVVFGGASAQSVAGNLTGASAFGNVTISNTSGTGSSSQSVTFADPVAVSGTLTMLASTSAAFPAGATTTIAQVDWRGTSVSPVWLRSTESGSQWYLDITQEQLAVEYVNVKDSNATSSQTGTVVAINSIDSGNNENWLFNESIGSSTIANADASQVDNAFSFQNKTDEALFTFKLTPESGVATVTEIAFAVSGAQKIATDNFSNLRLYRDHNSDAAYDAGDEQVGGVGVFTLTDRRGAITFTDDFAATTSQNYVLVADWNAPENGSFMTVDLLPQDIAITDIFGTHQILGAVDHIQHHRNNRGGGGGMRAAIGGEDIPPGRSEETGGGQNGGGTVDGGTGELIGDDPNFRNPAAHSGAWQDADRAYDRTDGTYATTDSANAASFYNHGFGVPETNQITGIEAKLEISGSTAAGDIGVQLSWDGGNSWTDARTTPTLTVSDKVVVFGGASDVWGRSWTADNFSNANFMIRLTGNPSANTIRVDALQVRVYHQATGGEQGGGGAI